MCSVRAYMHYLYKNNHGENAGTCSEFLSQCSVKQFAPAPFHLWIKGERRNSKTALGRLYFWLITFGRFRIWYLQDGPEVIHTSYVVPKCCKFPFLSKGEYEIGPCVTREDYRGKGIYPYMLGCILASEPGANFYMIVRSTNQASIRGMEKAGFQRCGSVVRSRILKNYRKEK